MKLNRIELHRIFPPSLEPKDVVKNFIKTDIDLMQKHILDMVKLWDAKLVKLRNEVNMHTIIKKIGDKAEAQDVRAEFEIQ